WGFINFVGAMGLFAMAIGLTLSLVDRPTITSRVLLACVLVVLFFTHIFRFPIAMAGVAITALVMALSPRRALVVALPLVPAIALFAIWMVCRAPALAAPIGPMTFHFERFKELGCLTGAFDDPDERRAFAAAGAAIAAFLMLRAAAVWLVPEDRSPNEVPL